MLCCMYDVQIQYQTVDIVIIGVQWAQLPAVDATGKWTQPQVCKEFILSAKYSQDICTR
jgi:hypothetical protein